ncbi:hypothetical protein BSP38_227 [Bacillus phage BSP38]|uniref:Uncharacterized protein n=1 Tax=Bacillus phage BSP38 TaxID=2283013 RepID=A0A345MK87_BPBSP|nr:hypothetical protein HWB82_gp091 [Bacillus phage BSP38]AXH71269.1 hypothetical protein BSP38_227 [Bacillus phage BSP38]
METNELKWEAYGDVNPFDHGGLWVLPNKDTNTDFFIVRVIPMEAYREGTDYLVEDVRIDLKDRWIELDSVKDYIGADENTDNIQLAIGVLDYYGAENCGGSVLRFATEEEARADVEAHGIDL